MVVWDFWTINSLNGASNQRTLVEGFKSCEYNSVLETKAAWKSRLGKHIRGPYLHSGKGTIAMEKGPFEDVFNVEHGDDIPANYVSLPEGNTCCLNWTFPWVQGWCRDGVLSMQFQTYRLDVGWWPSQLIFSVRISWAISGCFPGEMSSFHQDPMYNEQPWHAKTDQTVTGMHAFEWILCSFVPFMTWYVVFSYVSMQYML